MKHLLAVTALATGILASLPALAQDKTVVSFLHKFPEPENMAYFDAAVAEFEAANPGIDIVMEAVADEPYKDKIRVLMASDQVPDIYFSWSGEFGRKFAREGRTLDLTEALAVSAARLSVKHGLPMADSIMLATAHAAEATLWTQDADFEHVSGVRYTRRR